MEPRATTAAGPRTKTGTVHAHPLTLCNPRKIYPGFGDRWNCGYCNEEQRDGRMWHCGQAGCAFDACDVCHMRNLPARVPWSKMETPEQKAEREAIMTLGRKVMRLVQERERTHHHQRVRPPKEDERKRKAVQRRVEAVPLIQPVQQDTPHLTRIASRHLLGFTAATRIYPGARRGDGWVCSICQDTFSICRDNLSHLNTLKTASMYRCTRDGCDHQECANCYWQFVLDSTCRDARAPCIAAVQTTKTTAEPTPSHPEPIVTPIPVALWEGMD